MGRFVACGTAVLAALALAACQSRTVLPVPVEPGELSPRYSMTLVNDTGAALAMLPSPGQGKPEMEMPPGGNFAFDFQLRRFTVGDSRSAAGVEVLDNPYLGSAVADQSEIRFRQDGPKSLYVLFAHPSWFAHDSPTALVVRIRGFSAAPLFARGPPGGP